MASLLLRLFHSDYFSPHLALSYLRTYSDNIGITYYLVSQLESAFPSQDVEFYWPQLCHLLITKPSESRALECFVLRRCKESVHVALLTLWYFQASLYDLAANPHTASFQVCQRIFNQCQRILFDDPLQLSLLSPSSSSSVDKVSPLNPLANIVGIGAVLASTPGMPNLAAVSGSIAIQQARKMPDNTDAAFTSRASTDAQNEQDDDDEDEDDPVHHDSSSIEDNDQPEPDNSTASVRSQRNPTHSVMTRAGTLPASFSSATPKEVTPGIPPNSGGPIPTPQDTRSKKPENPFASFAAGFNEFRDKAAAAVGDVFGQVTGQEALVTSRKSNMTGSQPPPWHPQRDGASNRSVSASSTGNGNGTPSATRGQHRQVTSLQRAMAAGTPINSKSVPNLVTVRGSLSAFSSSAALASDSSSLAQREAILALYDTEARHRLLRSNYCRVQTQFLLSLQDISARLLLLPKPARLSALRAELTALNHKLPSEVCFPLWCTADDKGGAGGADGKPPPPKRHHRVVRINPSEAVVLNSADRVPFLLHVEVLNNELNFDPDRRQNKETLRRLVTEEDVRRRKLVSHVTNQADSTSSPRADSPKLESDSAPGSRTGTPKLVINDTLSGGSGGSTAAFASDKEPGSDSVAQGLPEGSGTAVQVTLASGPDAAGPSASSPRRPASPLVPLEDEEEVDLTEQAYGSDLGAFGEEREERSSDEEGDLADMNRAHDTQAWMFAREHQQQALAAASQGAQAGEAGGRGRRKSFSLDEYSERMRTAAIMLSQLNKSTNASATPIVNYGPTVSSNAQGGWSSWIVPTNWYGSSAPSGSGGGAGDKNEVGQGTAGVSAPISNPGMNPVGGGGGGGGGSGSGPRLVHAETEAIRKRIMQEMMALEEERMQRMRAGGRSLTRSRKTKAAGPEEEEAVQRAVNKDDPSAAMFRESWAAKKARIRASSPYGHLASWDVFSVIVKTGADLRQEQLAVQLINEFGRIWGETGSRCWVRYFRILVTSESSGLMETITDAVSIHSIKKEAYARHTGEDKLSNYTLYDHFLNTYGEPSSAKFNRARDRFMESLAAYSIISYLLQIKDRHNGNILVDNEGHLIHIDFGFMLGISPGGVGFEAAPFKMPQEYIDILGGLESDKFGEFKMLMRSGFRDVRKHAERIIMLVELMSKDSKLPCFTLGDLTAANLRDRFQLALSQSQCDEFVDRLIFSSAGSAFTRLYDTYQRLTEGVL